MSNFSPDYSLPDLLCCEDVEIIYETDDDDEDIYLLNYSPDLDFPSDIEESLAQFIEEEGDYVPGFDYRDKFQTQSLDASARYESVAWILKVNGLLGFQPLTAYLSVNYMDRFLASRCLPQKDGWPLKLLSVACLSLAAKMEEPTVPSLLDIQVKGDSQFIFEPRSIQKMELIVLDALNWRLRSITPFTFIHFFACKVDSTRKLSKFFVSRATHIILTIIRDITFLDYCPSTIAAASILCAAKHQSFVNPKTAVEWCHGLSEDRIISCYELMQEVIVNIDNNQRTKPPKVLPQLIVTTRTRIGSRNSLFTISFPSSNSNNKRRKLTNLLWVDDFDHEHKDES